MTAGNLSNQSSRETSAFSGSLIFRKWSAKSRSHKPRTVWTRKKNGKDETISRYGIVEKLGGGGRAVAATKKADACAPAPIWLLNVSYFPGISAGTTAAPIGRLPDIGIVFSALPPAGYAYSAEFALPASAVHKSLLVLVNANVTASLEPVSEVVLIGLPSEPFFGGL